MIPIAPRFIGGRPWYESTVPVPWRLWELDANAPEFGGTRWWNECGRKRALFNLDYAQTLAWMLAQSYREEGKIFHAYKCPWCEWWHLGHKKRKKEAK